MWIGIYQCVLLSALLLMGGWTCYRWGHVNGRRVGYQHGKADGRAEYKRVLFGASYQRGPSTERLSSAHPNDANTGKE